MSLITAKLTEEQIRQLKAPAQRERLFRTISYFSPILLLLLWEIASQLNVIDRRFFPPPSAIAGTAWQMIASFEIFDHIGATLRRVSVGYVMGAVPGILLGLILGLSQPARRVLGPIFAALYPVPKIAILPLILLIFGVGDASKFVVIAIGVFFLLLYNTMGGVMQTPQIYLDVAKNAGATRFQTFFRIALPSALPNIFTGLRLAAGSSYIIIAAAEFLGARSGVGFFIWASWQTFAVSRMFVGIVVISALGYLTILALEALERRFVPWAKH
ncbi:ABC transporter permease [Aminobacter sp. NyZ550]|jgi:NitT/TauT family transport system permease protein|uniref:NitT/TauT family transport system permease protein n=2 Tax=Aminobacter TaxID=31988 RepID=A0AAC8YMD9_AMIAI|nr:MULTISPECIES: ABC transporter permease [Aminobacter]AMS40778.1 Taurine ABC transporter permease [Aminobacter aminovorans]MBA8908609.1 NitT/TauT family transport system permease protein [Aminobacter ciceronei]MBA9022455.1 NitT/TauT family transport system permease protein [Aminobacter ciceronei]MBB3709033.1 NitT/TauT family transport system permease protein [Aminobacter aminovorans]MRX35565.1 ABC transporter permease subunit [Aminobacter sp. MDW-2]